MSSDTEMTYKGLWKVKKNMNKKKKKIVSMVRFTLEDAMVN